MEMYGNSKLFLIMIGTSSRFISIKFICFYGSIHKTHAHAVYLDPMPVVRFNTQFIYVTKPFPQKREPSLDFIVQSLHAFPTFGVGCNDGTKQGRPPFEVR